jgi:electron transfer flavoprotein beta subunit
MHIYVCVKQTPDSASVYVDPLTGQVDVERFVQVLNPADACAIEAAVRLKEQVDGTVTVLTLGPSDAEGSLRAALAIGADTAIRLWHDSAEGWGPFTVAKALATYIQSAEASPDLIFCGDTSSDWSSGIVGPALAQHLGMPQVTSLAQVSLAQQEVPTHIRAGRKLERGYREILEIEMPCMLAVTASLNEPRYPSLPAHLAALKAPIEVLDALSLISLDEESIDETILLEMHAPRPRPHYVATPNSKESAYRRIGDIVSGGATGRKTRLIEGATEELAAALVEFLRGRGFI